MGSFDISFDCSNAGKLEGILIWGSLVYTDGKVPRYHEFINLGSTDGKVLGTILVNIDGITPGIDIGT